MGNVVIFLLAVLLANVSGWADCLTRFYDVSFNGVCETVQSIDGSFCSGESVSTQYCCVRNGEQSNYTVTLKGGSPSCSRHLAKAELQEGQSCRSQNYNGYINLVLTLCTTKCEADSVAGCPEGQTWDSENCQCKPIGPPTPPPEGCTYCEDYLGWAEEENPVFGSINIQVPYSKMYHCSTCYKDDNGYIISAGDCTEMRNSPGTCQQNGDCPSNQICADSTGNDSPVECIATIGPNVWLRDVKTGNTFKCEADGDCARAKQLVATGECKNPYADKNKPNSSDSGNSSSSGENPNSSSAENPPESSGEFCDMCDKLERIAANTQATMNNTSDISQWTLETMNKTIDIDNHLTEMGVDVGHIRTNTEATATNTGSIDNKLNTTNSLLNDIKNKNWNPTINVDVARDTNIINVSVEGGGSDTSRAPAEILSILKQREGSDSDTAGTGATLDGLKDSIVSKISGDTLPNMRDSIPRAVEGVRSNLRALRDTIQNSAYGDSLAKWQNLLLNNGVLIGSGSDNCPSVFRRSFQWNMGSTLGTWNLGSLRYICDPIANTNVTFWQLARMVLRAMVAISCMLWIYRAVTGTDGGSNDED